MTMPRRYGKYGTRLDQAGVLDRTVDGITFASKREAKRYRDLRLMERAGLITDFRRQRRWRLEVNGVLIATYVSDFEYRTTDGEWVVEDVKGHRTNLYRLKRTLMRAIHGIEIREV